MHTLEKTVTLIPEVVRNFLQFCRERSAGKQAEWLLLCLNWSTDHCSQSSYLKANTLRKFLRKISLTGFMTSLFCAFSTCAGENHYTSVPAAAYVKRGKTAISLGLLCSDLPCVWHMNYSVLVFYFWAYFKIHGTTYIREKPGIRISQPFAAWVVENYHLHFLPKFF